MTAKRKEREKKTTEYAMEAKGDGWGRENYPYPQVAAFIECDELKCVGCGICQMACSMSHYGVINKDLARIQVRKYLLPLPKAVQVTCCQCPPEERECQKACPLKKSPAIYFDKDSLHMVVDEERCLGEKCLLCRKACPAKAVRIYPAVSPTPFVCDLCDPENSGDRNPQCVNVCPYGALYFKAMAAGFKETGGELMHDHLRKHADEKAELLAKRMYPLKRELMFDPKWR